MNAPASNSSFGMAFFDNRLECITLDGLAYFFGLDKLQRPNHILATTGAME